MVSPETATTPMPKPGLLPLKPGVYGTRPHALTLHIHIPITVLVLYYNDLVLPFSFFLITSAR